MWSTVLVLALGQAVDQPSGDGVGDPSDDSHSLTLLVALQDDSQPGETGEPLTACAQTSDDDKPKVKKKKKKNKKKKKKKKEKDWKVGYKDGLFVKSPDRNFKLEFTGWLQARYTLNRRVEDDDDPDKIRHGFSIRRAKLKAAGHVIGPWLNYSVTGAFDSELENVEFQSYWGRVDFTKGLSVRVGRFRPPLLFEERVSSKRQLAAERSLIARRFRQTRTGAIELRYKMKDVRLRGSFFQSTDDLFETEAWFVSGRVEWLLDGKWKRLKDFTSFPGQSGAMAVGAGLLYGYEDRDDTLDPDSQLLRWTADVTVEFGGASVFAGIIGNHLDVEGRPTLNQFGLVAQGAVFVSKGVELFTRYEWGDADGLAPDLSTITVGFNGYFNRHRVKFTADVGYGLNEVANFWSFPDATGWRTDDPGESGQVVVRAQFQLLF